MALCLSRSLMTHSSGRGAPSLLAVWRLRDVPAAAIAQLADLLTDTGRVGWGRCGFSVIASCSIASSGHFLATSRQLPSRQVLGGDNEDTPWVVIIHFDGARRKGVSHDWALVRSLSLGWPISACSPYLSHFIILHSSNRCTQHHCLNRGIPRLYHEQIRDTPLPILRQVHPHSHRPGFHRFRAGRKDGRALASRRFTILLLPQGWRPMDPLWTLHLGQLMHASARVIW